jgi:hypothetical protein
MRVARRISKQENLAYRLSLTFARQLNDFTDFSLLAVTFSVAAQLVQELLPQLGFLDFIFDS